MHLVSYSLNDLNFGSDVNEYFAESCIKTPMLTLYCRVCTWAHKREVSTGLVSLPTKVDSKNSTNLFTWVDRRKNI